MSQCNKSYKICRSFITFVVIEFGFAFERNENQSLYNISFTPMANNNIIFIQIPAYFSSRRNQLALICFSKSKQETFDDGKPNSMSKAFQCVNDKWPEKRSHNGFICSGNYPLNQMIANVSVTHYIWKHIPKRLPKERRQKTHKHKEEQEISVSVGYALPAYPFHIFMFRVLWNPFQWSENV